MRRHFTRLHRKVAGHATRICVRNKEHLLLGTSYGVTIIWHHPAVLTLAYTVTALWGTHLIRRTRSAERVTRDARAYEPRHLAN